MKDSSRKSRFFTSSYLVVALLSFLALEIAFLSSSLLETAEESFTDLRMRWRYNLTPRPPQNRNQDLILFAVDETTIQNKGKYGTGEWVTRKPYFEHLKAFDILAVRPTVLAYDIMFPDPVSSDVRLGDDVTESPKKIKSIIDELGTVKGNSANLVSHKTMLDINRLSCEQGDMYMALRLASIMDKGLFNTIFGFYFRGGWVNSDQTVKAPNWSDLDVFGDDELGNEESGAVIPYLRDVAIPATNIFFKTPKDSRSYVYSTNAVSPTSILLDYSLMAPLNVPRDYDGVVRRIPLVLGFSYHNRIKNETTRLFIPSLALMSSILHLGIEIPLKDGDVEVFMGREIRLNTPEGGCVAIPIDEKGRMYLNYESQFDDFDAISFIHAHDQRYRKSIDGRIGLVGVVVTGVDVGATPLHANIPLVYVQMTAISNILNGGFLAPLGKGATLWLMFIVYAVFTAICVIEKSARLGPSALMFGLLYFLTGYCGIHFNVAVLPVISPLLYVALSSFFILTYRFFVEERERRKIRGMFSTMVSDKVLSFLEERPDSFSLKGHRAEVSVFFSDIEGFTSISEKLPPEKITESLNALLTPATDCILEHGGYLDKYVGDSIMAVWGAPYPDPEHALKACLAAIKQQRKIKQQRERSIRDFGTAIRVRMSINSGIVTAGNMGSERKFQYTVMGDVVNFASRLEPVNKDFKTDIIIGNSTYQMAKEAIVARPLGKIVVVGKKEIVPIYELVGKVGEVPANMLEVVELYEKAIEMFYNKCWRDCIAQIDKIDRIMTDGVSSHLRNRVLQYIDNPPPLDWQGEYERASKS